MKFDRISLIFRLHGLSTVFRTFLKNVKTLEPKTYITILSIPSVISGRNIKGSIFPTLCHIFFNLTRSLWRVALNCQIYSKTRFLHRNVLSTWANFCASKRGVDRIWIGSSDRIIGWIIGSDHRIRSEKKIIIKFILKQSKKIIKPKRDPS